MVQEFNSKIDAFRKLDRSIVHIEIMHSFGGRWGASESELIVRIVYKGEKRLYTTLHEGKYEKKITELIGKTRAHFRKNKLERILDGD